MAEDHSQRSLRSSESIARTGEARGAPSGSDPLAELARLIGQNDPFGEAMHATARLAESAGAPPAVEWTAPSAQPHTEAAFAPNEFSFPPVTQYQHHPDTAAAHSYAPHAPNDLDHVEHEVPAYLTPRGPGAPGEAPHVQPPQFAAEEQDIYDDLSPPRRRVAVVAVAAIFGLAVVGTAGAFGYRTLFGHSATRVPPVITADKTPLKIVPNNSSAAGKKVADRVTDPAEKVVPREEKPVDISQKVVAPPVVQAQIVQPPVALAGNGVLSSEPKKVHTILIRPDGSTEAQQAMASPMPPQTSPAPAALPAAPVQAAKPATPPSPAPARAVAAEKPAPKPVPQVSAARAQASANAPLSLSPNAAPASRTPVRTASAGPITASVPAAQPAAMGHYAVQVSSQKSEAEAKAAFHSLQAKYAKQLGSQSMFVHKVELGAKGTYYRTMIGPFASGSQATELCSGLKAAGGSCIIQRN